MSKIKFGTDGWRAIIGQDFTDENVAKVIQAFCDFKKEQGFVYVGYDRRERSESSAKLVAQVLAANGFSVKLSNSFLSHTLRFLVGQNKSGTIWCDGDSLA